MPARDRSGQRHPINLAKSIGFRSSQKICTQKDVDAFELVLDPRIKGVQVMQLRNVGSHDRGVTSKKILCVVEVLLFASYDDDSSPFRKKCFRSRETNPARAAGNDRDLALQSIHRELSVFVNV